MWLTRIFFRKYIFFERVLQKYLSLFAVIYFFIYLFCARKADRYTGVGWKECSLKFNCLERVHVLHIVCECFTGKNKLLDTGIIFVGQDPSGSPFEAYTSYLTSLATLQKLLYLFSLVKSLKWL